MIFYTITPVDELFDEMFSTERQIVEIQRGSLQMQVEPVGGTHGRIVRLLSTEPEDYLQPAWQPGMLVNLTSAELPLGAESSSDSG